MVTRYTGLNQIKPETWLGRKVGKADRKKRTNKIASEEHGRQEGAQKRPKKKTHTQSRRNKQKDNHMIGIGQEKHPPQQTTEEERQSYKQQKISEPRQEDKDKDNECDTLRNKNV